MNVIIAISIMSVGMFCIYKLYEKIIWNRRVRWMNDVVSELINYDVRRPTAQRLVKKFYGMIEINPQWSPKKCAEGIIKMGIIHTWWLSSDFYDGVIPTMTDGMLVSENYKVIIDV